MKALRYIAPGVLILLVISQIVFAPKMHEQTEYLLDTVITVKIYGRDSRKAADAVLRRIEEIDRKFSAYKDDSEISKINNAPCNTPVEVDSEVYGLIKRAVEFSRETDGLFDITLKPLSDLWGIGTENARVPADAEISAAMEKTGWQNIAFSDSACSVTLKKEGMALDMGGIAKGYAADEAVRVLEEMGIENACLDLGGNIYVLGKMPLGLGDMIKFKSRTRPFTVGIQNPDEPRGSLLKTVEAEDCCIVTSGDYERYFEEDGVRYHHIFDPRTGRPARGGVRSATVIGNDSTAADALSTVFYILGNDADGKWEEYYDELIFAD